VAAEVWANDQVQIDGSAISLKYLKSWKEGSAVQPIDDGQSLQDKFGKDADWLEKTGRFCVSCPEGINKDIGKTTGSGAALGARVDRLGTPRCSTRSLHLNGLRSIESQKASVSVVKGENPFFCPAISATTANTANHKICTFCRCVHVI
jgi:hypothetical protein